MSRVISGWIDRRLLNDSQESLSPNRTFMSYSKQMKLKKLSNFFNNSHDTEQSIERQLSERHKLKQKLNKEKVDKFLFKYQRFLEKKDVEVLRKTVQDDDTILNIYYSHANLKQCPRLRPPKQLPALANSQQTLIQRQSISPSQQAKKHLNTTPSDGGLDHSINLGKSQRMFDDGSSCSDIRSQIDMDMSADSDSDSDSGIMAVDRSLSMACNQIKKKLIPHDEDKLMDQSAFYQFVKKAEKLQDLQQYFEFEDDTLYCQMANVQLENNLFPRQIAVNKNNFNPSKLNLEKRHIGDLYMEALCVSLKSTLYAGLKQLNLSENQITSKGLKHLIANFPEHLKELNLQDNRIGHEGCQILKPLCSNIYLGLKRINLENNNIRNRGSITLLEGLKDSSKIQKLNLSKNSITDSVASALYTFLSTTKSLEVLYLHWNFLKEQSGYAIAKALQRNPTLKVLDLSYNAIGSTPQSECIYNWCKLIENPKSDLTHVDLSFNSISMDELRDLSEALQDNHKIFGMHVEGNQYGCVIDSRGFLRFTSTNDIIDAHEARQQEKLRIDGVNYLVQSQNFDWKLDSLLITNCCWVCQGWQEVIFTWVPDKSGPLADGPIFLHVDFENFTPIMMDDNLAQIQNTNAKNSKSQPIRSGRPRLLYETNDQYLTFFEVKQQHLKERYGEKAITKFILKKMCPPDRRILYFFSNPLEEVQISATDQKRCEVSEQMLMLRGLDPNFSHFEFLDGTKVPVQSMNFVNYVDTKQSFVLDDKNDYVPLVGVFPRDKEKKYALAKNAHMNRKRKENILNWNLDHSFFRDYTRDNDQVLDECFEFDFHCTKITRYVKNDYDREKLKEYMRSYYHSIKDTFRYYSSVALLQGYETFCFPFANFVKFVQHSGIIDNNLLKGTDIEIDLISVKNNIDPAVINNPEKGLNRFQFLEIIFRLANDKYIRSQVCKSFADAFLRIMKDGLDVKVQAIEKMQEWRDTRFWTRSMDLLIKMKLGFLNKLYDYTTEITNKKWYFKLRWVSAKELWYLCIIITRQLLVKTDLISEFITDRDVYSIFALSMMTQVQEVTEDRHQRMSFPEFIEALARLAEKLSPAPIGQHYESRNLPWKQAQHLHIKFETLLTYFYQRLPISEKEMFTEQFNQEDARISMPTSRNVLKFKNSENFERTDDEQSKLNIALVDSIPWLEVRDLNKRLINPIGVVKYVLAFKEPYVHPNYIAFFNQEIQPPRKKKAGTKTKKRVVSKEKDKTTGNSLLPQQQLNPLSQVKPKIRRKVKDREVK